MSHALVLILPFVLCLAAAFDFLTYKIPNRLSVVLVTAFVPVALLAGLSPAAIAIHLGLGLVVLLVGFTLFSFGALGGGDAKLLAAASVWFGGATLLPFIVAVAMFGGLLAVMFVVARAAPMPASLARYDWAAKLHDRRSGIPYGLAIAAGGLLVFPKNGWIVALVAL